MKKKDVNAVLMSVLLTGAGGHLAQAEDLDKFELEKVIVESEANNLPGNFVSVKGDVGFLKDQDAIKTPFSITNLTEKTITIFGDPSQPLDSILANSPSVRQSGSILHNDFTFRGFRANGTSTYVNGVPGIWTQFNAPTHVAEKIEIIAGPNSGLSGTGTHYESNSAGGIINFTTKRAPDEDITRYTQSISGRSLFGEYIDISRRIGENKEWGIRINGEILNGTTAVKESTMKAKSLFINLDHKDEVSKTNLFAGYRDIDILNGQRWFKVGSNVTELPKVPNSKNNYSFDGMIKGSYGYVVTLNHEQKISKDWEAFVNFGYLNNKLNKNVSYNGSAITLKDNLGNFDITASDSITPQTAYYTQLGLRGKLETGDLKHNLTVAVDKTTRTRDAANILSPTGTVSYGTGNIYTGIINQTGPVIVDLRSALSNKTNIWGYSLVDSIEYKKLNILLGIHKHNGKVDAYNTKTGERSSHVSSDATSPTYGLTYAPNDQVAFYASHSENFDVGSVVGSTYKNSGTILAPAKTKQDEFGVKYLNKGFMTTLAFFDISQANNIDVTKDDGLYQEQNGRVQHKGVELSVNGKIAEKWSVMGGISYLDAKYRETSKGLYDGLRESGRGKWTAVTALEYAPDKDTSIIGRAVYTGKSPVNYEKAWADSYVVVDFGVEHKTKIMGRSTKIGVMCYNLFNKEYWQIARGDNLYLSTPRTLAVTMAFDF